MHDSKVYAQGAPATRPDLATFLKNHAGDIWACGLTVVHDLLCRTRYIFVIIELETRRIVHTAVTSSPTMPG